MTKQDMRIVKTKNALHHALLDLLDEKLLEDISVTEICRTANINRGTFYLHYAQIEDLFEEYFKEITGDLSRAYQRTLSLCFGLKSKQAKLFNDSHLSSYSKV